MFDDNVSDNQLVQDNVAPGSPAAVYAAFQQHLQEALLGSGAPNPGQSVRKLNHGVGVGDSTFSHFRIKDGKLANFKIDGNPIRNRLAAPTPPVAVGPVEVTLLAAYRTVSDEQLTVVFEVAASEPVTVADYEATYVDFTGRQVSAVTVGGSTNVRAGARLATVVTFPQADVGGSVEFPVYSEDFASTWDVTLQITPLS